MGLIHHIPISEGSIVDKITGLQCVSLNSSKRLIQHQDRGFILKGISNSTPYKLQIQNSGTSTNTGDWSISLGFIKYGATVGNGNGLITKLPAAANQGWTLSTSGVANTIYLFYNGYNSVIYTNFKLYTFNHIVATNTGGIFKLYLNGVLKATSVQTTVTPNTTGLIEILNLYNISEYPSNLAIDSVSIYNHALSQKEINNLYSEWLLPKPTVNLLREMETFTPNDYSNEVGLVAAYSGNIVGNLWLDKSGNEKHGTKVGTYINSKDGITSVQKGYISYDSNGLHQGIITITCRLTNTENSVFKTLINNKTSGGLGGTESWGCNILNSVLYFDIRDPNNGRQSISLGSVPNKIEHDFTLIINFNNLTLNHYIDGILVVSKTFLQPSLTNQILGFLLSSGNFINYPFHYNGSVKELLIYNKALTQREITAYHKKWIKPTLIEKWNYGADGVVKQIPNWITKSGTFKIGEFVRQRGELITNGGFDTDTVWSKGVGWSILNGGLTKINTGTNTYTSQPFIATVDKLYKVTLTITNYVSGILSVFIGGGSPLSGNWTSNGTYSINLKYISGSGNFYIYGGTAFAGTISNISVVEIDPLPSITTGTNYLECVTAGNIAIPSNQAYGTWIWDMYKAIDSNELRIGFIDSDIKRPYDWSIFITNPSSNNSVRLYKGGVETTLTTPINYINSATFYTYKIINSKTGIKTLYIKGGKFGNNWTTVGTLTDNTYPTSNYFNIDIGAGDRIANLQMYNEII